ncbi:MAG: FG-GAP-like repeat-containing protein [Ignavibacteria bacterium]
MRTNILLFLFIFLPSVSISQPYFQKITSGDIVNTQNYNHTAASADYDNDGDLDIVVTGLNDNCSGCNINILFYRNDGDGNFTRIYDNAIAQTSVRSQGLAWADYDNDGWMDLFICCIENTRNKLFHNDGNGNFTEVTSGEIVTELNSSQFCAWADYDKDGWLDIYVTNRYGTYSNRLYKNNGDGTFTKILSGSIANDIAESRGCAWGDYDNDGWPDLYVTNYSGQNDFLYHNNQDGTFSRIFNVPMVNVNSWASAAQWIDFDNNGVLDLYVTNNDRNNTHYYNHGNGNFTVNNSLPSNDGKGYGFTSGDYDNDGLTDLFICNINNLNKLYKNNGASMFTKVTNEIISQEGNNSTTSSLFDYNMDGKLDLIVTNRFGYLYNYLYKNIGNTGNYITVKLNGCTSNRNAIGAKITVHTGNMKQYKEVSSSWDTQNYLWPHFGIGNYNMIDSLIVEWPSDQITKYYNFDGNRIVSVDECLGIIGINEEVSNVNNYELYQNYPNPFNPITNIKYEIPSSGHVTLKVYDILGNEIASLVNEYKQTGSHQVKFDIQNSGIELSSGLYFYRLSDGINIISKSMLLIK